MKQLTYISLFSSAGVGCYGFKMENFECIATNELLSKRLEIQKHNNVCKYQSGYIEGDITRKEIQSKLFKEIKKWQDKHQISTPDVIMATPPCQGMSVANHKKGDELGRNSLVVESIKITKKTSPKFFVFENVRAFLNTTCTDIDGKDKPIKEAIKSNLSGNYNILFKIVNLKDYGSNSSRTRTLVIGVRKDLKNITPYDIFPDEKEPPTLKKLIGHLPSLKVMGEIDEEDIFHAYRKFDKRMLPWIENLKEGQSAFENKEKLRKPHRIINGQIVYNKNKNSDKYSRWYWNKVAPCIHTRNDILASQNTIHPSDNRVFSIRELMLMMSIPRNFKWSQESLDQLNSLTYQQKVEFFKQSEMNIRQSIGEAVPTEVIHSIARKIKNILNRKNEFSTKELRKIIEEYKLQDLPTSTCHQFIEDKKKLYSLTTFQQIFEYANQKRSINSAFFTRQDIVFSIVNSLPNYSDSDSISILEPSVGIGNFLPLLIKKYKNCKSVNLELIDIDNKVLDILRLLLPLLNIPPNFNISIINADFLLWETKNKYDIVIGNPPYGKVTKSKKLLDKYKLDLFNKETNNIFSFFIEQSLQLGKTVSFIVPKSLLNAPEFNKTRELLVEKNIIKIYDYGETAFKGVKIETIGFMTTSKPISDKLSIESFITSEYFITSKKYIIDHTYPYWIIYRNAFFDEVASKMKLGVFTSYRDRQITKRITKKRGEVRVLKSRNIGNNKIVDIPNYDQYIDYNQLKELSINKYFNKPDIVLIPNLTYNPRAVFLPKNTITDGSVALLEIKHSYRKARKEDLEFYSTPEFKKYYKIARNYGTRSLNIDNNSVYFFGLLI